VRIRLDDWSTGKLTSAPSIGNVALGKNGIPAVLYAGYGPVVQGPRLKANAAIQATASALLRLAFPAGVGIEQALSFIHQFGCAGGRSRNGWGSFELEGEMANVTWPLVDWREAMKKDWAHALGKDERGALLWETRPQTHWEDAMRLLAQTRADMRRRVPDRLMLAYPDTKGVMPGWKNTDRVPNSLRFKVRSQGKQFVGLVFHLPCRPADELWNKLAPAKQSQFPGTFADAHRYLDSNDAFIPRNA
jgi:CRISPR-associated protein Cmr1